MSKALILNFAAFDSNKPGKEKKSALDIVFFPFFVVVVHFNFHP